MSGEAATGTSPRILTAAITVAAPPAGGSTADTSTGDGTSASTLPETGPGDSIPALIIGLIALQVGLVVAVRSHRALAPASRGGGRHRVGV